MIKEFKSINLYEFVSSTLNMLNEIENVRKICTRSKILYLAYFQLRKKAIFHIIYEGGGMEWKKKH